MSDAHSPLGKDLQNTFFDTFNDQNDLHCSAVAPSPLNNPVLVSGNALLAAELGLNPEHNKQRQIQLIYAQQLIFLVE